jgi:2-polyprenyl-3-methyl-5-hydroxy-6-metoxy-1,4-benzoquinol methylase
MMNQAESCPVCRRHNTGRLVFHTRDERNRRFSIKKCINCNAYFLSPAPTPEILAEAYDDSYYGGGEKKFGAMGEQFLDHFRMQRAGMLSRYMPKGGRILDVGCGNGRFLKSILRHGTFELHGLETPGKAARRAAANPQLHLKVGSLEPSDFPENYFDAVTLFHVFEHLPQPMHTLKIIAGILRRGGVCVVSFPNIASLQAQFFRGHWFHLDPPRHLSFLEPDDFVRLASGLGLAREARSFFSLEQNPYGAIQSVLNSLGGRRNLLYEVMKGNPASVDGAAGAVLALHVLFMLLALPLAVLADFLESVVGRGATVQFVLRKK